MREFVVITNVEYYSARKIIMENGGRIIDRKKHNGENAFRCECESFSVSMQITLSLLAYSAKASATTL